MVIKSTKEYINGFEWEINIIPATDPELYVDGDICRGTTWFGKYQIFLSSDLTSSTAKRVIVHELTHAYLFSTQMRVPETFTEEEVCDFIACWADHIYSSANNVYKALYCEDS